MWHRPRPLGGIQPVDDPIWRVQEGVVRMFGTLVGMAGRPGVAVTITHNTAPPAREAPPGSLGLPQTVPIKEGEAASFLRPGPRPVSPRLCFGQKRGRSDGVSLLRLAPRGFESFLPPSWTPAAPGGQAQASWLEGHERSVVRSHYGPGQRHPRPDKPQLDPQVTAGEAQAGSAKSCWTKGTDQPNR